MKWLPIKRKRSIAPTGRGQIDTPPEDVKRGEAQPNFHFRKTDVENGFEECRTRDRAN